MRGICRNYLGQEFAAAKTFDGHLAPEMGMTNMSPYPQVGIESKLLNTPMLTYVMP